MTTDLFGGTIPDEPDPYAGMGQDARRTAKRRELLAQGIHPATRLPLANNGDTCGDCAHLILKDGPMTGTGSGKWWKCIPTLKGGHGPDITKSWPACRSYEPRKEGT